LLDAISLIRPPAGNYAELHPAKMEAEIQRLIREVPGQRSAALRALTILRARRAASVARLSQLADALTDLPDGEKGYLAQTRRARELAGAIVRQQLRVGATNRPYFREIETRSLVAEIRNFQGKISGMKEPLAREFRKASDAWLALAEAQAATATEATSAEPVPQVFRAGDPLAGERKRSCRAFVCWRNWRGRSCWATVAGHSAARATPHGQEFLAQKYNTLPAEAGDGGVCLAPVRAVVFFHQRFLEWPSRGD
jgi:hypothetical protein